MKVGLLQLFDWAIIELESVLAPVILTLIRDLKSPLELLNYKNTRPIVKLSAYVRIIVRLASIVINTNNDLGTEHRATKSVIPVTHNV